MFTWNAMAMGVVLLVAGCVDDLHQPVGAQGAGRNASVPSTRGPNLQEDHGEIPDDDPVGILLGPLVTRDDGEDLGFLILKLDVRHPCTGDLDIQLAYDGDGDGYPEVRAPVEFFRSRPDVTAEELYACPPSLNGTYFFRDDPGDADPVFRPFRTLPRGHAFYLAVADTLAELTGSILGWSVGLDEGVAQ